MRKFIVLLCILSLLVPAVVLAGCGSGGSGESTAKTPDEVAKAFWAAALKGDADKSWAMFSKSMQAGLKNKAEWAKSVRNDTNASVKAGKATVTGDTATVPVKILSSGQEVMTQEVSLVKEDGVWKVQFP